METHKTPTPTVSRFKGSEILLPILGLVLPLWVLVLFQIPFSYLWFVCFTVYALGKIAVKMWRDNRELLSVKWYSFWLVLWYIPIFFVLSIAIGINVFFVDPFLEIGVARCESAAIGSIEIVEETIEFEIEKPRSWYNPLSWVAKRVEKEFRTVQKEVIIPAKWYIRLGFAFAISVIRTIQYFSWFWTGCICLRSFVIVAARVALKEEKQIVFHLPPY